MHLPEKILRSIWEKASIISGMDPKFYRKDRFGFLMYKPSYGKTSAMGWEVDHVKPKSKGGNDNLSNLQPLFWWCNRSKSNK